MADLAQALAGVFAGGDVTIFQATVDAVGEGVVTVHSNGGTFADVPYLQGAFYPEFGPSIGDPCYVLGRENWGMLVIGKPAPGPNRSIGDSQTVLWEPFTLAAYNRATGAWSVPGNGEVVSTPGPQGIAAVYLFNLTSLPAIPIDAEFATASFYLAAPSFNTGGEEVDYNFVTVGLHANATPAGVFQPMANLNTSFRAQGFSGFASIPLDWAQQLINGGAPGGAKGVYVQAEDWPTTLTGPGTIRLTTL